MITFVTEQNLDEILEKLSEMTLWVPILADQSDHYTYNNVSCIYVFDVYTEDEYVFGFSNVDTDNLVYLDFLSKIPDGRKFCYNSRYLSTYHDDFQDADLLIWYHTGNRIEIDQAYLGIFGIYGRMYPNIRNVNDVIPIMRIIEYCRAVTDQFIKLGNDYIIDEENGYIYYDEVVFKTLINIERSGFRVDQDKYFDRYGRRTPKITRTEYNPYTLTGRPSSKFGGVNFNSLSKSDGSREMIISQFDNGRLFEFDYDSYHPRLIGKLIGYELPETSVHRYFAKSYFGTSEISQEQYEKSKIITFKQLYGNISPEYAHIEFFQKISEFMNMMWDEYLEVGYFTSPLSGRKFKSEWYTDMNKAKMFNYIIQCYETEVNMMVLEKIIQYLYSKRSKLVMYTYDSILVDYDPEDGIEVIQEVKRMMSLFGCPVHTKVGVNYNDMVDVSIDN